MVSPGVLLRSNPREAEPMHLDHVALATRDVAPALDVLVGQLGAHIMSGGHAVGFRPMQVFLGDGDSGMKVELLEPWDFEHNDFLDRFLTRHGDGPHHLTFKVQDLEATIDRVRGLGYSPIGIELSEPIWREAFLDPKQAHGTVVQLAESSSPYGSPLEEYAAYREHGPGGEPMWWPQDLVRAPSTAALRRVVLRTPTLDAARDFFTTVLDGTVEDVDDGGVSLVWTGGGRIRLEEDRTADPGIDRLELEGPGPARDLTIAGARVVVTPQS